MSEPDPAKEEPTPTVVDSAIDAAAATDLPVPPPVISGRVPEQAEPEAPPVMVGLDSRFLRRALIMVVITIIGLQLINYAWGQLGGFLFNLLLAWLVAISFDPIVSYLAHRGLRRGLATAIVALTTLGLLALFITVFGGILAAQTVELVQALPTLILDIVDWVNRTFNAEIDPERLLDNLNLTAEQATDIAGSLAGGILVILVGIVGAVFDFVTILVFSFYFSADSPRIKRWIASWLKPVRQVVFIQVWDISVHKAGGFVISKLALATLSAAFHCFFFYLIDIPFWLPMGIFAGVVSQFIPTIGTYIGVALPALFAVFDEPIDVLWIVVFATVYQQIENYVFTPRISTKTMDINSGVALASVFVGAALFGPIGAIIGIPLAAIIIAIFEAYGQRYEVHPYVERNAD